MDEKPDPRDNLIVILEKTYQALDRENDRLRRENERLADENNRYRAICMQNGGGVLVSAAIGFAERIFK